MGWTPGSVARNFSKYQAFLTHRFWQIVEAKSKTVGSFTPRPHHVMFLTRPSVRLALFIACYVVRAGEGLGTRLHVYISVTCTIIIHVCE